ncbi:TRI65 protein, partial [Pterocles burchelli]|nr:TRI65 protein [Pterocles burchelli]
PVVQKLEEKLVCSICLELFRVPVTLPCGHNFCKRCIRDHWHQQEQGPAGAGKGFTCPTCRRSFEQRPELEKNVTLCSVVELGWESEARVLGSERCEVTRGELCPQHGRPLELYCQEERRCICCVCTVRQCQQHQRVLLEEERSKRQVGTMGAGGADAQHRGNAAAASVLGVRVGACRLSQLFPTQESSEGLKSVILSKCAHLKKALEDFQCQTVARIEQEQAAALGRVGENWSLLRDHLDVLGQHRERAQRLLACPDHRTFLQELPLLPSLESLEALPPVEFNAAGMVEPIAEILTNISRLLLEDLPGSVAPKAPDPPSPAPSLLFSPDHRNLTFDPDTANKYLEFSEGNRKAKHGPRAIREEQGPRFEPWQVLCTQGYSHGHHYWEVTISNHSVILGVTSRSLPWQRQQGHKFNIGLDGGSWGLQVREDCYLAWHKGQAEKIRERLYRNLGVSLDFSKGLLSFYGLGERMQLIHTFHHVFTEPLYPVFWLCEGRAVMLCRR